MQRRTERELREAPDYEELKWYNGVAIVIAAYGETWKRLADAHDYKDADYFVVADDNESQSFSGTYADDEPIEPSN